MAVEKFRDIRFRDETRARIDQLETILSEYDQKLTSRQVFYQFVSRGWLKSAVEEIMNGGTSKPKKPTSKKGRK